MSIFMVSEKTVEAINGVRSRGYLLPVRAISTGDGTYVLITVADGTTMANVDENAGTVTYPGDSNG